MATKVNGLQRTLLVVFSDTVPTDAIQSSCLNGLAIDMNAAKNKSVEDVHDSLNCPKGSKTQEHKW